MRSRRAEMCAFRLSLLNNGKQVGYRLGEAVEAAYDKGFAYVNVAQ